MIVRVGQADARDCGGTRDDAFAEKKTGRLFEIVTGRPHRNGNSPIADAHFERLFHRKQILCGDGGSVFNAIHRHRDDVAHHWDLCYPGRARRHFY